MTRVDNIVETDGALILGAGIAGLFTALKLAPMPSIVLAGTRPGLSGSSAWAQGGIAASVAPGDSWQSHAHDTMVAGAGLCDPAIVDLVAKLAPARIEDLVGYGAPFDRNGDGTLAVSREAAHSLPRIVHVKGDGAGAAISATLAARANEKDCITLLEGFRFLPGGRIQAGAGAERIVHFSTASSWRRSRIRSPASFVRWQKVRSPCGKAAALAKILRRCGRVVRRRRAQALLPLGRCPACRCGTPCAVGIYLPARDAAP